MGSLRVKKVENQCPNPSEVPEVFSAYESLCKPSCRKEEGENVVAESVKLSSLFSFISSCLLACRTRRYFVKVALDKFDKTKMACSISNYNGLKGIFAGMSFGKKMMRISFSGYI